MHIDLNIAAQPRTPYRFASAERPCTTWSPLPLVLLTTISLGAWGLLAHLASVL